MAKRLSVRGIRKHRHYTYEDAADIFGISVQTVRSWKPHGLFVMADKRPHVILGEDLIAFIQKRQAARRKPSPDRFLCFTCKNLAKPLDAIVFYTPLASGRGQLEAVCGNCGASCHKFASDRGLDGLRQFFEIVMNGPSQD